MKRICVIPAKNEAQMIEEIINRVQPHVDEILVINSKYTIDNTRMITEKLGIRVLEDNGKGKGDAIKVAIENIKDEDSVIVFIDADGSHIPEDIPKLFEPIINNISDMVIASRMTGGSEELHGTISQAIRLFGSVIITLIINYRWNVGLTDSQNGFRALRTSVAKKLDLKADIFDIETEMIMKCLKKGYRVSEIPSRELKRKYGASGIVLYKMWYKYVWRVLVNLF